PAPEIIWFALCDPMKCIERPFRVDETEHGAKLPRRCSRIPLGYGYGGELLIHFVAQLRGRGLDVTLGQSLQGRLCVRRFGSACLLANPLNTLPQPIELLPQPLFLCRHA